MTAIVTDRFRFSNLRNTKKRLDEERDRFFLGIGRSEGWTNDSLPPTPDVDLSDEQDARHALQSVKKISDYAYCAPRYNWQSGATYESYDDADPDLHTKKYYVLNTSNFNVYLCLKAGSGASTIEPIGLDDGGTGLEADKGSVSPTEGADGYVWKYLYTISAVQATKFLTNDFLPVFRDSFVADNAIQGAIYNLEIDTAGAGYSSAPTITIEGDGTGATATATVTNGAITKITMTNVGSGYTYATASVSGGSPTTAGVLRPVVSPPAFGREIERIDVTSGGTSYTNGAMTIDIEGDGTGATATGTVTGGVLQSSITVSNAGFNYTEATAKPSTTTAGTEAELAVKFTDLKGGFGYDPVIDLNAYYIMFNVVLEGDENPAEGFNGDFIPANNYRQLVIIKNPLDTSAFQELFTDTTGIAMNHHVVQSGGTWILDDVITGSSSGAKAIVDYYDANTNKLFYHQTRETGFKEFSNSENLSGVSLSTGTISASGANQTTEIDRYSGEVLYLENRPPVSRAADQTEDIKLVIQF